MSELIAIATNEYSSCESKIPVVPPKIVKSFWSSDKEGNNIIERGNLENMVYFHIETQGIPKGTMELQLFDEDTFSDDDEFGGEKVFKTVTINNNKGLVELHLPGDWASDLKNEEWNVVLTTIKIHYRKLYWKANYKDKIKNEKIKTFLEIRFSDTELYIKPSSVDEKFPELFSNMGEQIVILAGYTKSALMEGLEDRIKDAAHHYAVGKMSHGYLVTKDGVEFGPYSKRGNIRDVHEVQFYNSDGRHVITDRGYDFASKTKNGNMRTTYGVDQYEVHYQGKVGCKVKVLGALSKVGDVMDVFEVFKFAMNPSKDQPLPIPIPGADVLGMIAYDKFNEIDEHINTISEEMLRKELDAAKLEGVDAVKQLVGNYRFRKAGYELIDISPQIASGIIHGQYNNIDDIINASYDYNDNENTISVLFRRTQHPISELDIAIIETFFVE